MPESLSDDQLLRRLGEITRDSRRVEAELVAHIAEVDARRLYAREGCSSMFACCVEVLHLSEPETNLRLVVARATRRHPMLLDMLRDGRVHLSGIALLAPHLTETNRDEVLARATHCSKRRIEELVAGLAPRPDVPTTIRKPPDRGRPLPSASKPTVSCLACVTPGDGSSRDESSRPDETNSPSAAPAIAGRPTPNGEERPNGSARRIGTQYADTGRPSSSRSPLGGSGFSSRQAVPSGTSSSGWKRCSARRCRTATWQR